MNIVSNLIFHCNYCDANTAFITIHDSTAAAYNFVADNFHTAYVARYREHAAGQP